MFHNGLPVGLQCYFNFDINVIYVINISIYKVSIINVNIFYKENDFLRELH